MWRTRQGVRILDLLDGLPRNSRYRKAVLNDPEVAKVIVDREEEAEKNGDPAPEFEWEIDEYSPVIIAVQRLERLLDELAVRADQQLRGKKSKRKPRPLPKLRSAIEAERASRRNARANSIIERFTPWAS